MEAKQIKQLTPEQIKLLVRTAQDRNGGAKASNARMERNPDQLYPLSKAQERLWFLTRFSEGVSLYNNPLAFRLKGYDELDIDIIKKAWHNICDRHEILRTTFHLINDRVMQQIHPVFDPPVFFKDLRSLPPKEKEEMVLSEAKENGNYLFDTAQLPLVRLLVLRTEDNEYVVLINAHHLLTDGWTNAMIAMELPAFYASLANNVPSTLPPVNRQFIDYVQYEQDWIKTADFANQLAFWKDLYKEIPPPLTRLSDFPRAAHSSYKGSKVAVHLHSEEKQKIISFCKTNNTTPFQFLINAYAILLYRYSGHPDFVIGTPVANRNNIHFQNTFGPFINTLPVPFHFSPGLTVREFLAQSGDIIQKIMKNQAVPFASLIEELNPPRDIQSNPLFQVHFAYQVFPQVSQGVLSFSHIDVDYDVSKFDLNLWIEDDGDEWVMSVTYLADLFHHSTIRRLMECYTRLIVLLTAQPGINIDRLDFIAPNERSVISASPLAPESTQRHWLRHFHKTCKQYDSDAAIVDKNGMLTYGALNSRAEQLAHHLRAGGVTPGSLVGICLDRSADMILCMLALFKIGAAYLPIDPGTPTERLAFMIEDSGVANVICSVAHSDELKGTSVNVFLLDKLKRTPAPDNNMLQADYDPASLAYVIYTSGTSGKPKGVRISHRSLINYTEAIWERMKLAPGDSFANVSSLAADLGNTMIFPALAYGGILLIVPEECLTDTWLMSEFFQKHPHDTLKIVPSHILALLDTDKAAEILPRELLILGGETCTVSLVKKIRSLSPGLRIINHYGPTETTIGALTYEIPENSAAWESLSAIPIGKPLANTSVYLMDSYQQPVAKGSFGEICIGGANLSLGYINRDVLEQVSFVPDPDIEGGRLYRTGDYGKFLPDGNILYMGRMDRQVKIRGYRIELNEVEYALNSCKGIKQAVILPPAVAHGQQGLTAVICLDENSVASAAWEQAARKLRSPMLPDKYIVVDKIPVTANGKVDYAQLHGLSGQHITDTKKANAPRDLMELELLGIWKQALKIEDLSIEDDFFELGGHSLLAVKLLSQINEQFGIRLPLSVLFEHNNVKQLAKVLRSKPIASVLEPALLLQPSATKNQMFVLHPAGGNVMCYYPVAKSLKNEWQVTGIQATGFVIEHDTDIPGLAKYYFDEILGTINKEAPVIFAGWSMGALLACEMACLYQDATGKAPGLVIIDQPAPSGDESFALAGNPDLADRLVVYGKKVSQLTGIDLDIHRETVSSLDEQQRSQLFMDKFRQVGLLPEDIQLGDFHGYLELMLRHNEITMEYQPQAFHGPALVVRAGDRLRLPGVTELPALHQPDLGWGTWLTQCSVTVVPGNHVTIMDPSHAGVLSDAILSWAHSNKEAFPK